MPRIAASGFTITQLENLLSGRRAELNKLEKQRRKVSKALAQIDARIGALGGASRNGGGGRVRNEMSLVEMMAAVLGKSGKAMGVGEIEAAVRSGGYRTNSANFRSIVNQTLIKDKRFSSAGRGMYQLKK